MIPIVFINCKSVPFIEQIISGQKRFETRNSDTLRNLVGNRVLLAETGKGKPVVRCFAEIGKPVPVTDPETWERLRKSTCVPVGSPYDWKPETKQKILYPVRNVRKVRPFTPSDDIRHGRVWMEYIGTFPKLVKK